MAILQLPEPVSTALGTRTGQVRLAGLALSVLLTGLAVAVAGPVGLVALIAPELARLASHPGRLPLTASALLGALLMTVLPTHMRTAARLTGTGVAMRVTVTGPQIMSTAATMGTPPPSTVKMRTTRRMTTMSH